VNRRKKVGLNCQRERAGLPGSEANVGGRTLNLNPAGTRDQIDNEALCSLICPRRPPLHSDSTHLHTVSSGPLVTPYKICLVYSEIQHTTLPTSLERSSLEATESQPSHPRPCPAPPIPVSLLASALAPSTNRTSLPRPSRPRFLTRMCTSYRRRLN
jgi:hypothetical protein